jgi:probable HAF family extracellular repeat protein
VLTTLTLVEGGYATANAINDNGQVTGYGQSAAVWDHAFLYDINSKVMTDLGTLEGLISLGNGLNDLNQVVGRSTYDTSENQHAFLYAAGDWTDLGVLSGGISEAFDINNRGQIVGESYAVSGTRIHAFVYEGGVMTDLAPGWYESHAYGINERAQIVGWYKETSFTSPTRAFLYTPAGFVPDLLLLLD